MSLRPASWFAAGVLGLAVLLPALFAEPSAAAGQAATKPANLKVLPKDASWQDVYAKMSQMKHDLGVECSFCHDEDPDSKKINYASDENPRKETARAMMRMTQDINEKYLGSLGDRQYAPPITCGNCHLGQMHPPPFEGK